MKVKIDDLLNSSSSLEELSRKDLPSKIGYQISRIINIRDREIKILNDIIAKKTEQYGTLTKVPKTDHNNKVVQDEFIEKKLILPNHDNWKTYIDELNEVTSQEVDVYGSKIKLNDLDSVKIIKDKDGKEIEERRMIAGWILVPLNSWLIEELPE